MKNHDYDDANEEKLAKCLEPSSIQNDTELEKEQDIKANDEEMDAESHVECLSHEVSKTKKRKIRIDPDMSKNNSVLYRKKGPTH